MQIYKQNLLPIKRISLVQLLQQLTLTTNKIKTSQAVAPLLRNNNRIDYC